MRVYGALFWNFNYCIWNKTVCLIYQELMRVYGALFWNFAPLLNVVEPPRMYIGSYWSQPFHSSANNELFYSEEVSLLRDLYEVVANAVENKIATIRQHANRVLVHAVLVDKYIEVSKPFLNTSMNNIFHK